MRPTDIAILDDAETIEVALCARTLDHAFKAIGYVDRFVEIPGYRFGGWRGRLYRPRGGRRRRLTLSFYWTGKPDHHEKIHNRDIWQEHMRVVEVCAGGRKSSDDSP